MKRLVPILAIIAAQAQAFEWPWAEQEVRNYAYCGGFVSAGLGEFPVENLSRTQLWLAWNDINNATASLNNIDPGQWQSGRERFADLLAASDIDALLQIADDDCGVSHR